MDKRITLITGASQGIGRAAALALAKDGHHVIALARSKKALEALDDEIKAADGSATLIPFDLKDATAFEPLGQAIAQKFERLDGLLANAGVLGNIGPLQAGGERHFNEVIDINLSANWRLIRVLDPLLRHSDSPRALFMTSSVAQFPRAFWGPYQASKAGLEALVRAWADENEKTNLRVNLFNPGATRTAMRANAVPGEDPQILPSPDQIADLIAPMLGKQETRTNARINARDLL